jgi:hypothetical protein
MKLHIVSYHLPDEQGTAAGRQLLALAEAFLADGHQLAATCWRPDPPGRPVPAWCELRPTEGHVRPVPLRILTPRIEVLDVGLQFDDDTVVLADEYLSWPAAAMARRAAVTMHYAEASDQWVLRELSARRLQDLRAQRRAARRAPLVWALSDRVRRRLGGRKVPATLPAPREAVPSVSEPRVSLLADWSWPPNHAAAKVLLECWPAVKREVPAAQLLLAGRGEPPTASAEGIRWLGEVTSTSDLLEQTAVFAFPCPRTSGPKLKVLDAMAHGVAVATTRAGLEGIDGGEHAAAVVTKRSAWAGTLIRLLRDEQARAELGAAGWNAFHSGHRPDQAAAARIRSLVERWPADATP